VVSGQGSAIGAENGGTSGMIVDNVRSSGQASSLYFSTLGAAACGTSGGGHVSASAVKRTQAGLQSSAEFRSDVAASD
jgi:hypothetical protein